ncbi:carboxylesterase family protein [Oribacterium sp. FC2011]|uniref:carboxylesterase family protein n=1 Tax=Oribacterium sp. FC2011 TaxID=1408311 RepID=UPI0006793A43|nr:carboxylesterase family protein [Oribacterium sp. FC2011]
MKKLFTIDDFMVAFIAALGYGFGENIAYLLGWPVPACIAACLVAGIVLEEIISLIVFSKAVQKKPINRFITLVAVFLIVVLSQCISVKWMGVSMLSYIMEESVFVIGLPIISFVVNLIIRAYHIRKIRKIYGDGDEGYVFDVKKEDIEETNMQNQLISGEYDEDCAVKTRTGIYVGEKQKKAIQYLGIPYAKPPVSELRWKAPEPLPSSDNVFEAVNFGASAIQVEHSGVILKHHRQSEDCLYLNIFTGAKKTEVKKPVLVLFHHGDYTYGGSADPLLYGNDFVNAHPNVVFVSFNYRLGIFGFIDFSTVPGGEAYPDTLNLGLLDQIAALKWIKENISQFGGDPDKISVLGFESGATSICMLTADKRTKGLFNKAFVFFGSPEMVYDTPDGSRILAENLLKETGTSTLDELVRLDTETLKDAAQKLWKDFCGPVCDGTVFPADLYQAYREGCASDIDFIIGIPSNETSVLRSFVGKKNYEALIADAMSDIKNGINGPIVDAVQEYIRTQADASAKLDAKSELVEDWLALSIYRVAASLSEGGNRVYLLYWDEKPVIEKLGSGTVDAVATLLGNSEALHIYGNVINKDLSLILQTFLLKFINGESMKLYTNEIAGVDALKWKAFPRDLTVSKGKILCD